jgi:hypothetical protein
MAVRSGISSVITLNLVSLCGPNDVTIGMSAASRPRAPKREVNRALFSKSDLKVFDEIIERYGNSSFEELFEITHDHYAYRKAWKNRRPGSKRSQMFYEDMIEDRALRESVIENIGPFASNME